MLRTILTSGLLAASPPAEYTFVPTPNEPSQESSTRSTRSTRDAPTETGGPASSKAAAPARQPHSDDGPNAEEPINTTPINTTPIDTTPIDDEAVGAKSESSPTDVESAVLVQEPLAPNNGETAPTASASERQEVDSVWLAYGVDAGYIGGVFGVSTFYYYGGYARGTYFVIPYLGVSLEVLGMRIGDYGVFGLFELTPEVVFLALPRRRVTPVISTGLGLSAFGDERGTFPRWTTQVEVRVALPRHITLGIGVDLSGLWREDRFERSFQERDGMWGTSSVHFRPFIGVGFRGGRPPKFPSTSPGRASGSSQSKNHRR